MIFYYTYKSVPYSAIIKGAFFCSRWKEIQKPTGRHYAEREGGREKESLEVTVLNGMSPPNVTLGFREP